MFARIGLDIPHLQTVIKLNGIADAYLCDNNNNNNRCVFESVFSLNEGNAIVIVYDTTVAEHKYYYSRLPSPLFILLFIVDERYFALIFTLVEWIRIGGDFCYFSCNIRQQRQQQHSWTEFIIINSPFLSFFLSLGRSNTLWYWCPFHGIVCKFVNKIYRNV